MIRIEGEWRYLDGELKRPMPWYTGPCLEWLITLDLKGMNVFEYGIGDSTFWFEKKGLNTFGVDHDPQWKKAMINQQNYYWYVGPDSYKTSIAQTKMTFDIVVIDGVFRDECTEHALNALKPGGYLIVDNYRQASADLLDWPLTEKLIEGMDVKYFKELEHKDWTTIVVTKPA